MKKIVIIGGSSGMGLAIAKASCEKGHEVVIAGRSKEKLKKASQVLKKVKTAVLDVTDERQVVRFFASLDSLDHLVISAADFVVGSFLKMETKEARRFFDSKFWGQYTAAKYAAPKIRKGGSIIFFCGIAGQKPMNEFAAGCAINAAIEGLTRALALELGPIRVNAISPGTIHTPVWDLVPEKERLAHFKETAKHLPVKRIGKPEDVAQAALYLMECGYATGSIVYVDGGDRLI